MSKNLEKQEIAEELSKILTDTLINVRARTTARRDENQKLLQERLQKTSPLIESESHRTFFKK